MFPFISKLSAILQQRGVIRIQSNIYDEDFLQKYWTAFSLTIFENNFTADVRIGSKYAYEYYTIPGKHSKVATGSVL